MGTRVAIGGRGEGLRRRLGDKGSYRRGEGNSRPTKKVWGQGYSYRRGEGKAYEEGLGTRVAIGLTWDPFSCFDIFPFLLTTLYTGAAAGGCGFSLVTTLYTGAAAGGCGFSLVTTLYTGAAAGGCGFSLVTRLYTGAAAGGCGFSLVTTLYT